MRRWLAILAVLLLISGNIGLSSPSASAAGAVNTWITIATTTPSVGCSVNVSVEVRSGGNPVSGLIVEIAFFDPNNTPLSTDAQSTNENGVAFLAFDTSGANAGESDWLDINIDGSYLKGTSIVPSVDGGCDGNAKAISASAEVSISLGGGSASAPSFPTKYQAHSLSCEYASLELATTALGNGIDESVFLDIVPFDENPHNGFRGSIDGEFGNTDDYGVYAEPLAAALETLGFNSEVWYNPQQWVIQAELDAGHPTLVWIATHGDTSFYEKDKSGEQFLLVPYGHVVVAYDYDETGIFVSDSGNGELEHFTWEWFIDAWSVFDGMALSVALK